MANGTCYDCIHREICLWRKHYGADQNICGNYHAEAVRCKDCKHFTEGMAIGMCKRIPEKPILPMRYDDFCSYGEKRKTDNQ